jgi:hypothetical protein
MKNWLTGAEGSMQSHLFKGWESINPMVAISGPLLYGLQQKTSEFFFEHEFKVFQSKLRRLPYPTKILDKAEQLILSYLREKLTAFPLSPDTDFYLLLESSMRNPVEEHALLELAYMCLGLGYEGSEHPEAREIIIDHVCVLIQQGRKQMLRLSETQQQPKRIHKSVLVFFCLGLVVAGLVGSFTFYHQSLNSYKSVILQQLTETFHD